MAEEDEKGFWKSVKRLIIEEDGVQPVPSPSPAGESLGSPQPIPISESSGEATFPGPSETADLSALAGGAGGELDLAAVYAAARIAPGPSSVEKAIGLLQNLPADTPLASQQAIVIATLRSFGVDVQELLQDSGQKRQALIDFVAAGQKALEQFQAETETKITAFQQEIEKMSAEIQARAIQQQNRTTQCRSLMEEMARVENFFKNLRPS